jgi:hypothetical protein
MICFLNKVKRLDAPCTHPVGELGISPPVDLASSLESSIERGERERETDFCIALCTAQAWETLLSYLSCLSAGRAEGRRPGRLVRSLEMQAKVASFVSHVQLKFKIDEATSSKDDPTPSESHRHLEAI